MTEAVSKEESAPTDHEEGAAESALAQENMKRAQAAAVLQSADQYIDQVLGTVVVGIGVNLTGIQSIHVATRIAYFAGVALGRAIAGADLSQMLRARAQFKEAFMAGLGSVKPAAPNMPKDPPSGIQRP